jgi:hypothetical protein
MSATRRFKEVVDNSVDWFPDAPASPRLESCPSLKLEVRGVTSQKPPNLKPKSTAPKTPDFWAQSVIHRNVVAAKLRQAGATDLARKLEDCHSHTTFAVCTGCSKVSSFANRCDLFYCPQCASRLQKERESQVKWWANEVRQPKHVVLTVANFREITPEIVDWFRACWTRLRRSKFASNWRGGFYRFEITNEGKGWHLHLHALVDALWIDQFGLSQQWNRNTDGAGYIVKVKDARSADYLHEVTKYVVKGHQLASWKPLEILQFIAAFDGKRTFGVFGNLYGKRAEFAEWIADLKNTRPACECGCEHLIFYSETEWLIKSLDLVPNSKPRPPAQTPQPTLPIEYAFRWPD